MNALLIYLLLPIRTIKKPFDTRFLVESALKKNAASNESFWEKNQ